MGLSINFPSPQEIGDGTAATAPLFPFFLVSFFSQIRQPIKKEREKREPREETRADDRRAREVVPGEVPVLLVVVSRCRSGGETRSWRGKWGGKRKKGDGRPLITICATGQRDREDIHTPLPLFLPLSLSVSVYVQRTRFQRTREWASAVYTRCGVLRFRLPPEG